MNWSHFSNKCRLSKVSFSTFSVNWICLGFELLTVISGSEKFLWCIFIFFDILYTKWIKKVLSLNVCSLSLQDSAPSKQWAAFSCEVKWISSFLISGVVLQPVDFPSTDCIDLYCDNKQTLYDSSDRQMSKFTRDSCSSYFPLDRDKADRPLPPFVWCSMDLHLSSPFAF